MLAFGFVLNYKRLVGYFQNRLRLLDILLFIFCVWELLSITWATNTAQAFGAGFRTVALFCAYMFLRVLLSSDNKWRTQLPWVVSVASSVYLAALWVSLLKVAEDHGLNAQTVYMVRYPTETKNLSSIFLLVSTLFHVHGFLQYQNWKRWFSLANILIAFGTLFLLSTRGVSLAIITIGAAVLLLQMFWNQHRFKFGIPLAFGVMLLGTGHWFFSDFQKARSLENLQAENQVFVEDGPKEDSPQQVYRSANERLALWEKTFGLIKQDPILGVGVGNWQIEYPRNGLDGLDRAQFRVTSFKRPHNEALGILCETGVIGLVLMVLMLLRFFQVVLGGKTGELIIGLALVGLLVAAMFDFPRERMEHNLLLAVILALPVGGKSLVKLNRKASQIASGAMLCLSLLGALVFWLRYDGESNYPMLRELKAQNKYQECIDHAEKVENPMYTVDWINYPISWYTGICYTYEGNFTEGEKEFVKALQLNPGNFHTHNNLGFCIAQQERYNEAIPYFESSLKINSRFEEARFNLAYSLIKTEKFDEASEVLEIHITDTAKRRVFLSELNRLRN